MSIDQKAVAPTLPRGLLARRWANIVRYSLMNLLILAGAAAMAMGGAWMWAGQALSVVLAVLAEELLGDAGAREDLPPAWYLNLMLYLTLPLLLGTTLVFLTLVTPGLAPVDWVLRNLGFDPDTARGATGAWSALGGLLSLGMFYGAGGVNVAHELVHRTDSPREMLVGRWLLALTCDTAFAIEHVYGHHRTVGTELDPATARRGEYVLGFAVRSTIGQNRSALAFERARLQRRKIPDQPWTNRYWRGQLMSLCYLAAFLALAGPMGAVWFFGAAAVGKAYLELVNYVEHYGLVRMPGTRIEPRHSWNSHRRVSTGILYNLPLHSDHHMFAGKPFWKLNHAPSDAPVLPMGYLPMVISALVPPLWSRVITPRLADWDRRLASADERAYLTARGQYLGGDAS